MNKIDLNAAKEFVATWNERAGNPVPNNKEAWREAVELQTFITMEEILETVCAAHGIKDKKKVEGVVAAEIGYNRTANFDYTELLDGVVDSIYTLSQLITLLEHAGFDVAGAYKAVCDNNQMKLFKDKDVALLALKELNEQGKGGLWLDCHTDSDGHEWWTIKNENGKVCKYHNFPKVDLEGFLPTNSQGEQQ